MWRGGGPAEQAADDKKHERKPHQEDRPDQAGDEDQAGEEEIEDTHAIKTRHNPGSCKASARRKTGQIPNAKGPNSKQVPRGTNSQLLRFVWPLESGVWDLSASRSVMSWAAMLR